MLTPWFCRADDRLFPQNRRVVKVLTGHEMTSQRETSKPETKLDADLLAVRKVIEDNGDDVVSTARGETNTRADLRGRAALPPLEETAEPPGRSSGRSVKQLVRAGCHAAYLRAKAYRPERKRILWTSLVLMLLLQPFFVIGWSLFCVGLVVALYLLWGGNVFWRRLIAIYQKAAHRWPEPARHIKLRAYVMGKKWDWILDRVPDRIADQLRGPDLRRIIAADAQHDAVMSERLTRL